MATITDYPELDLTYLNVDSVRSIRSVLSAEYGDGYKDTAIVGAVGGRKSFSLSAGVWPDSDDQPLIDGETIFEYYYEFFEARLDNGNEPFIIEWRDRKWLVDLAEPNHGIDVHTADLFTPHGIEVRMRRVSGLTHCLDGSVFDPLLLTPYFWERYRNAQDFPATLPFPYVNAWGGEFEANGRSLEAGSTDVIVAADAHGAHDAIRMSSSTNDGVMTTGSGPVTIYDAWFVMKMREATFSNIAGILSGDVAPNNVALAGGGSGTTHFFNLAFGDGYSYEKNNVGFAESNQQAPMNVFGVVHIRSTSGIALNNIQVGKDRDQSGRFAEADFLEIGLCSESVPDYWAEAFNRWLMTYYTIP